MDATGRASGGVRVRQRASEERQQYRDGISALMSLDEVRRLHLRQQLTESQQADFDELYGAEDDEEDNLFGERVEVDEEDDDYEDDEFHELPARLDEAELIEELDEVERRRMEYYIRQHPDLLAELYRR